MRILVLHSDVPPEAPPDEQDTLISAEAVAEALVRRGHDASQAAFRPDLISFKRMLAREKPDLVFNLVESVFGAGLYASLAPAMLDRLGMPYTGGSAAGFASTTDKLFAKTVLRAAGLPTPDWSMPPDWAGLGDGRPYIVKAADEDASIGLDDAAVLEGAAAIHARADDCARRLGGHWFAESFVDGREFNIAVLEEKGAPRILPMAEMVFADWPKDRPRIVGWRAKWDDASHQSVNTVRKFGVETEERELAAALIAHTTAAWSLFSLTGYARIDFRIDANGKPFILELNPNPGIAPDAGFAAAAARDGMDYDEVIARIVAAAKR